MTVGIYNTISIADLWIDLKSYHDKVCDIKKHCTVIQMNWYILLYQKLVIYTPITDWQWLSDNYLQLSSDKTNWLLPLKMVFLN